MSQHSRCPPIRGSPHGRYYCTTSCSVECSGKDESCVTRYLLLSHLWVPCLPSRSVTNPMRPIVPPVSRMTNLRCPIVPAVSSVPLHDSARRAAGFLSCVYSAACFMWKHFPRPSRCLGDGRRSCATTRTTASRVNLSLSCHVTRQRRGISDGFFPVRLLPVRKL